MTEGMEGDLNVGAGRLAIARQGKAFMEWPSATKTTEKNGTSSLFPFFFSRFPTSGGIDSRLPEPSMAMETVSQSKSHSVPSVISVCSVVSLPPGFTT
jgi:hypothetical protein